MYGYCQQCKTHEALFATELKNLSLNKRLVILTVIKGGFTEETRLDFPMVGTVVIRQILYYMSHLLLFYFNIFCIIESRYALFEQKVNKDCLKVRNENWLVNSEINGLWKD